MWLTPFVGLPLNWVSFWFVVKTVHRVRKVEALTKNTDTLSWVNTWILESPVDDDGDQTWGKYGHL